MLKMPHSIISCLKMTSSMSCSGMAPVVLWGSSGGGRLLYVALDDKLRKLLREKVSRVSLEK